MNGFSAKIPNKRAALKHVLLQPQNLMNGWTCAACVCDHFRLIADDDDLENYLCRVENMGAKH